MNYARCRYCKREIVWIQTLDGQKIPFEQARWTYTLEIILGFWAPVAMTHSKGIYVAHMEFCKGPRKSKPAVKAPAPVEPGLPTGLSS